MNNPIVLALVNTPAVREAMTEKLSDFEIRWEFESSGLDREGERGRPEITAIAELHPVLIVIELDQPVDWLPKVHSDPATRRIPVVAIANDHDAQQRANDAKATITLTPDEFVAALPQVVTDHARIFKQTERLHAQCDAVPSELVLKGLREFNAQEYFEAHETLEAAWKSEFGPIRELYRAILQVGVAYLQIQRGNYWGAQKMFVRALQWFDPLPDWCQGINVAQLRTDAKAVREHLETLGPERMAEFDHSLLKPVLYEGA
jgi:hypothetical protein